MIQILLHIQFDNDDLYFCFLGVLQRTFVHLSFISDAVPSSVSIGVRYKSPWNRKWRRLWTMETTLIDSFSSTQNKLLFDMPSRQRDRYSFQPDGEKIVDINIDINIEIRTQKRSFH